MADEKPKKDMTEADAAKLVYRLAPALDEKGQPRMDKDGKPTMKRAPIAENEVMSFGDYEDRVVVVTKDGHKFTYNKKTERVS